MQTLKMAIAAAASAPLIVGAATPASASYGNGAGQCAVDQAGRWIQVECANASSTGGSAGSGGSGHLAEGCTISAPLTQQQAEQLGLQWPPPKGESWAVIDCLGGQTTAGPQAVLVSTAAGTPAVTPEQLLTIAMRMLQIPALSPGTAPPRGKDGLVGLPEWFWVPAAEWHALGVTVTAGPVWATVTATPDGLTFEPGGGLTGGSCSGPGTSYDPELPAAQQHSDCSYTYQQSSASQANHAYQASVVVTWRITWMGSGGAAGLLDAGLPVPYTFALRIAQGEALVSNP